MAEKSNDDFAELQAFVSGSLQAIMSGISDAQIKATLDSPFGSGVHAFNAPTEVAFDIAVSAERTKSAKGGFSLRVLSVGAGADGEVSGGQTTATRLQFSVRTEFKSNTKLPKSSVTVV